MTWAADDKKPYGLRGYQRHFYSMRGFQGCSKELKGDSREIPRIFIVHYKVMKWRSERFWGRFIAFQGASRDFQGRFIGFPRERFRGVSGRFRRIQEIPGAF